MTEVDTEEATRDGAGMTMGVDLGDRYSQLCALDEHGEVCEEGRIATTARAMRKRFEGMARCRVVIEVGTHSPWAQRLLEELGHEVITAHTHSVRLIYGGKNKNDRLDAERLARLARVDPKLLHPRPRGRRRMTRGWCGSLRLHRTKLPFAATSPVLPAHGDPDGHLSARAHSAPGSSLRRSSRWPSNTVRTSMVLAVRR